MLSEKINKYYKEHPLVEIYNEWKIRKNKDGLFTCDLRVGVESCQSNNLDMVKEWIDLKIKQGKIQKEYI